MSDDHVLYNGGINPCIDSNKVFDTRINEHVSNDTVFQPVHEVNNDLLYKTQRQTSIPYD